MDVSLGGEGEIEDDAEGEEEGEEEDEEDGDTPPRFSSGEGDESMDPSAAAPTGEVGGVLSKGHQMTQLLHEALPLCYNQERADQFVHRFCHLQPGGKARKVGMRGDIRDRTSSSPMGAALRTHMT